MTHVTEISITEHRKHVIKVKSSIKKRPPLMIIIISDPLPAKLPRKKLPVKFLLHQKVRLGILGGVPYSYITFKKLLLNYKILI